MGGYGGQELGCVGKGVRSEGVWVWESRVMCVKRYVGVKRYVWVWASRVMCVCGYGGQELGRVWGYGSQ